MSLSDLPHCCEMFERNVVRSLAEYSSDHPLVYSAKVREVGIVLKDGLSYVLIEFCPWCGIKFPPSLRSELFRYVSAALGIAYPTVSDLANAPIEFQTDEWWQKRRL